MIQGSRTCEDIGVIKTSQIASTSEWNTQSTIWDSSDLIENDDFESSEMMSQDLDNDDDDWHSIWMTMK